MSFPTISSSSFYGQRPKAPSNGLLQRIEDSVKKFKEHPLVSPRRCSLHDDKYCWKIFRRQNEALTYLKSCSSSEPLKLFCFESISMPAGCRTFLISTVSHFWNVYKNLPEFGRHCYEVIREATRCRLYFDLEFYFNSNPNHNGEQCIQIFVSFLCERIHESFGIECTYSCIVDLDASTEKKFSRHLIVHLPENAVFEDNLSVGNFVKDLCARLKSMSTEERRDRSLEQLFVINDDGQETLICDLGVYTRNRNFRLFLSSKMNQKNPLKLAKACEFYTARGIEPSEQEVFFDSLIEVLDGKEANVLACTSDMFAHSVKHAVQQHSTLKNQDGILEGRHERSPFPEIDCFFEDYLQRQNPAAAVRSWIYFKNCQQLLLAVNRRFRYCHRIGREHRRNHIMYMVDLKRAVFYQKCFDPDCQAVNYRSNDFVLPDNVAQSIRQTLESQKEQQQNETHIPSVASSSGSHWTLLNESTTDDELLALIAHYELVTNLCMICSSINGEEMRNYFTLKESISILKQLKAEYFANTQTPVYHYCLLQHAALLCTQLLNGHEVDCMISTALLRQSEFHVIPCHSYRGLSR
ncbi:Coiled-coil domain-containing protein -like protein [Trichinella nativa]|uniref:DNA-directed primase/polymerase protein n=1 Tax=Trichinella nativa TaxID=6335 RepID=A0A0V1L111_9BILA|nr:Coiled-coil domain-containing protein -like protein [Trichinella nativa]